MGPGQARIRVTSASVNPVDAMIRARPRQHEVAAVRVPGVEVVGVITDVGPAVDRPFTIGDAVMAIMVPSGEHGGCRAHLVAKIPAGFSNVQAAPLPMNGLTARLVLAKQAGHGPHRYFVVVHALDVEHIGVPADAPPRPSSASPWPATSSAARP
ncbi:alcohol dehydrogenase catalytic domain-containing protein [Actinomadura kijaniata]|uniref:alcohol dehydrogenase catalytic domain-containing protein n=1 Tax=Actinomadura kijaniata TaxID=46161 RepID=UPI00350E4AE6